MRVVTEQDPPLRFAREVLPYLGDALELATCLAGPHAAADDLVQEAFTRAFLGIEDFTNCDARAWILTMVFSAWLNRGTPPPVLNGKEPSALEQPASKAEPEDARAGPDVDQSLGQSLDLGIRLDQPPNPALLERSIASLPTVFREVLLLRKQGLSYNRISEIVGVPIGTVMSRLARARRRMKQSLANSSA